MKHPAEIAARVTALVFLGSFALAVQLCAHPLAQSSESQAPSRNSSSATKDSSASHKPQPIPAASRLTIQVTAGEKNDPVDSASVYVKFILEHKLRKDKRFEMNVKTNRDGIAHVPEPPKGKVLIQIIAPGWKPFGKWFEIEDLSQPIQIHLEKPARWY